MSNPTIRTATRADATTIHRTVIEAWSKTVDPRSSGHRLTLADVDELLRAGGGFVAESAEGAVGCVLWAREGATVELMKLAVVRPARGAGLGSALIAAVERLARSVGARDVLLAVSAYSPGLVPWYESLGYRVAPDRVYAHASPLSDPPTVLVRSFS